jgi:hypothetical protein
MPVSNIPSLSDILPEKQNPAKRPCSLKAGLFPLAQETTDALIGTVQTQHCYDSDTNPPISISVAGPIHKRFHS